MHRMGWVTRNNFHPLSWYRHAKVLDVRPICRIITPPTPPSVFPSMFVTHFPSVKINQVSINFGEIPIGSVLETRRFRASINSHSSGIKPSTNFGNLHQLPNFFSNKFGVRPAAKHSQKTIRPPTFLQALLKVSQLSRHRQTPVGRNPRTMSFISPLSR